MRRRVFSVAVLLGVCLLGEEAGYARGGGFSVSVGLGGGIFSLDKTSLGESLAEINRFDGALLTQTLADGFAMRFAMAYNIKGYASLDLGITGHGWNLTGDDVGGSGHVSLVAHFHPLELWLPDRDFDATVFLGGGYSIVGGGQEGDNNSRGLDGGTIDFGLTGRYFFTDWFSAGAEIRFYAPFFTRWFVDWGEDESYDLKSAPSAFFTALLLTATFHFAPAGGGGEQP